jgi:hypothetical protein
MRQDSNYYRYHEIGEKKGGTFICILKNKTNLKINSSALLFFAQHSQDWVDGENPVDLQCVVQFEAVQPLIDLSTEHLVSPSQMGSLESLGYSDTQIG